MIADLGGVAVARIVDVTDANIRHVETRSVRMMPAVAVAVGGRAMAAEYRMLDIMKVT